MQEQFTKRITVMPVEGFLFKSSMSTKGSNHGAGAFIRAMIVFLLG